VRHALHCVAIALAAAACMAGSDATLIARLPDVSGLPHMALLLREHDVYYGQRMTQAIRLSGATPVVRANISELEARLDATFCRGRQ
jgi:hypothetical protein